MNQYQYKDFTIEVINEPAYDFGSSDNLFNYEKSYFGEGGREYPTSKHGLKIIQNDTIIGSCILIASGGATGIHDHSTLLDTDCLLVCCSDTIFCLALPTLESKWIKKADQVTCFGIYKEQGNYIVHGELQITKLDKEGNPKWEFSGADIFVSIDGEDEIKFENDGILLTDFSKTQYKINYDGQLLWDHYTDSSICLKNDHKTNRSKRLNYRKIGLLLVISGILLFCIGIYLYSAGAQYKSFINRIGEFCFIFWFPSIIAGLFLIIKNKKRHN